MNMRTTASWVIREKATGAAICETYDQRKVAALNTEKYEAVAILNHLAELNQRPPSQQLGLQRNGGI